MFTAIIAYFTDFVKNLVSYSVLFSKFVFIVSISTCLWFNLCGFRSCLMDGASRGCDATGEVISHGLGMDIPKDSGVRYDIPKNEDMDPQYRPTAREIRRKERIAQ